MNESDHRILLCLSSSETGLNGASNPDLCNAGAVLYQLSYQAKWDIMWVNYKPADVDVYDDNTRISILNAEWMNKFDHRKKHYVYLFEAIISTLLYYTFIVGNSDRLKYANS